MTIEMRCVGCNRTPSEIEEYSQESTQSGMSPDDYVYEEEGTLNKRNGHFYCTACYCDAGMPTGVAT